jgi:periplasmic protein TonB
MYADRHARPGGFSPGSLVVAIGVNGAVVAALLAANPDYIPKRVADPFTAINIPIDEPPPPPPPPAKPSPKPPRDPAVVAPDPIVEPIRPGPVDPVIVVDPVPLPDPIVPGTGGIGTAPTPPVTPVPALIVDPAVDPRFADALQPPYPTEERRAEREGRVVVRVLVGIDGRVRQVERVSATSDGFWRVTERQALTRWRFRPGTRDGVPQAAWRQMAVRFVLDDA